MNHPPFHEACTLFQLIEGPAFNDLCLDVDLHGIQEPVWTWTESPGQEWIIDGRNRCRALDVANRRREERGEKPWPLPTRAWDGQGSLVEFVYTRNFFRRHLNETDRAMAGARMVPLLEAEAETRQKAGLKRGTQLPSSPIGAHGKTPQKTRETVAKLANVSARSVDRARRVISQGTKELIGAVDAGKVSVSRAAEIAKLTPAEQLEKIRQEADAAKRDVRQHDLRDTFDRWGKIVEKLSRQFAQHDPRLPALAKWAQKGRGLLREELERLLYPPRSPSGRRPAS